MPSSSRRRVLCRRVGSVAFVLALAGAGAPLAQRVAGAATPSIATVSVTVDPPLVPDFDPAVSDYILRCAGSFGSVSFSADLPAGTTVAVNGGAPQAGNVNQAVPLYPNQRMTWTVDDGTSAATFHARCLPADFPPVWNATVSGAPQAEWYFAAPSLTFFGQPAPYAVIADARGTPVWWMADANGGPVDQKVLSNTGSQPELAWTTASFAQDRIYWFYGLDGQLYRSLGGFLDLHDLQPTAGGTYLGLKYVPRNCPVVPDDCVDLSPWGGPASVNPIDAEVVELDAGNNLLDTWSTRDRVALEESATWIAAGETSDIVHINSVEPDGDGFLFSARHLDAVYRVSKATGEIDWKLGGTPTDKSLTVVGDTSGGPVFSGQHDARVLPDGTITVHDNGTLAGRSPRSLRFELDLDERTATVLEDVRDVRVPSSGCCGSSRRLSGGNWVVAAGPNPFVTELAPDGEPVLTITFADGYFSYRAVPVESGVLTAEQLRAGMDAMSVTATVWAPGDGSALSGSHWLVAGTTGPATGVEFLLSGNGLVEHVVGGGIPTIYGWLSLWDTTTVPDGTYTLVARATKDGGSTAHSAPITVLVSNLWVTIFTPADGALVSGPTWLHAGTSSVAVSVEFLLSGNGLADVVIANAASTIYGWFGFWDPTTVPEGTYTMVARARDSSGNAVDSSPVTVTVAVLSATILAPSDGDTLSNPTWLVAGTTGAATRVDFVLSGNRVSNRVIGTGTLGIYGWALLWDPSSVPKGTYQLVARAFDASGSSADSAPVTITVAKATGGKGGGGGGGGPKPR